MPQFSANPHRFDPYRNVKFRVKWNGRHVAGISRVSGLVRTTEVVEHREGGDPSSVRRAPGRTTYLPITLERGVTHDTEFEQWADQVHRLHAGPGTEAALKDFRRDVVIELYNEAGQLVMAYNVYRAWPSEFRALPELDADATAVAIQSLTLQHEGWERDAAVSEPVVPAPGE